MPPDCRKTHLKFKIFRGSMPPDPPSIACLQHVSPKFRPPPPLINIFLRLCNRARRQSGFPTFISCQRQDAHVLPKRRQSHQGDKLCNVSTVPLVARWPVFLARGSDADGEPHYVYCIHKLRMYTVTIDDNVQALCVYTAHTVVFPYTVLSAVLAI